jgi:hypothetical protein
MSDRWAQRAPWTGIAAVVFALVVVIVGGESPDSDAGLTEIRDFYGDEGGQIVASIGVAFVAILFTFFAATLRSRMRRVEALSNLTLIGGALFAAGLAIFAGINFTLVDLVNSDNPISPGALQSLNALNTDLFFPAIIGLAVFYFSTGLAILSTAALPRWWGWITLVLAIFSIAGPLGFAAFVLTLPWTLVSSILLMRDASPESPPGPGAAAAS